MDNLFFDEGDDGVHEMSVFQNGRSDAIRLPKEFGITSQKLLMKKQGDTILIREKRGKPTFSEVIEDIKKMGAMDELWEDVDDSDLLPLDDIVF
ncbi:MAG: hypothetical protein OXR62_12075 [Ahrensia sp.]|nr:hypothetical protein [Ahrensia sp.]